jgi:hypothetical protein
VNGYTESGDPVLTLTVGPQTAETLVASAGVQFRTPFMVNGRIISPYLNLTAERPKWVIERPKWVIGLVWGDLCQG